MYHLDCIINIGEIGYNLISHGQPINNIIYITIIIIIIIIIIGNYYYIYIYITKIFQYLIDISQHRDTSRFTDAGAGRATVAGASRRRHPLGLRTAVDQGAVKWWCCFLVDGWLVG